MTVLCFGYYDKFSRFFLGIKKELKKENSNLKFKVFSICFSGFLYTLIRLEFSYWLPAKAWFHTFKNQKKYFRIIKNKDTYKGVNYKNLIKYHQKLNSSISTKKLLFQALAYIDIFEKIFENIKPDLIILVGDSRLSIETSIILAKKYNIKTYYIEQGPFNSTFFNDIGVNANAKIHLESKKLLQIKKGNNTFTNNFKNKKYNRSPIYRGFDYLLDTILEKSCVYPPDLKYTDTFPSVLKTSKKVLPLKINKEFPVFLLILQVPLDVNMINHSPFFSNHYSIIKTIHENLPNNSQLIIREHPVYKNKYEKALYEYTKENKLNFDYNTGLHESLNLADVVIVNNSTVGVEAIALKKTVIVLGNSYYDHSQICIKYNKGEDLKLLLENALKFKPQEYYISTFLNKLMSNHLVEGSVTDLNLKAAKVISKKITHQYTCKTTNLKRL